MRRLILGTVVSVIGALFASHAVGSQAQREEQLAQRLQQDAERFIDDLLSINCPLPGISGTGTFNGFLADDSMRVTTIIFEEAGAHAPIGCQTASIQNILWLGPGVLPALIRHLEDKRPTKLAIGGSPVQLLADEYSPRHQVWPLRQCINLGRFCEKAPMFKATYRVKVGDVCFVLIGQIVNRPLNAVRYQPSGIEMVNSPVETPALADRVRADWSGMDREGVRNSLLADLHATKLENAPNAKVEAGALALVQSGALRRLRFYFPDTYASLSGADLAMRAAFEKAERSASH